VVLFKSGGVKKVKKTSAANWDARRAPVGEVGVFSFGTDFLGILPTSDQIDKQ